MDEPTIEYTTNETSLCFEKINDTTSGLFESYKEEFKLSRQKQLEAKS